MKKKERKKVNCQYCKKVIFVLESRILDGRGKFCSKKCFHLAEKSFPLYVNNREKIAKIRKGSKDTEETKEKKRIARRAYLFKIIGKKINSYKGYILIYDPNHFTHEYGNYVQEHRYVIEKILKRPLKSTEHVHHINCNKKDNRIVNLMVLKSNSAHQRMDWGSKVYKDEIIFDGRKHNK